MLRRRGAPEVVKSKVDIRVCMERDRSVNIRDFEPVIGCFVQHMIFVAKLLRGDTLFQRLSFGSSSVLVRPAYIQRPPISRAFCTFQYSDQSSTLTLESLTDAYGYI